MKEIVKEMLTHPVASMVIISAVGSAIKGIVGAARGTTKPLINLSIDEKRRPYVSYGYRPYSSRHLEKTNNEIKEETL